MRADVNVFDAGQVSELQPELVHDFPGGAPRFIQRSTGYKPSSTARLTCWTASIPAYAPAPCCVTPHSCSWTAASGRRHTSQRDAFSLRLAPTSRSMLDAVLSPSGFHDQ